jgi:hypothetical protein
MEELKITPYNNFIIHFEKLNKTPKFSFEQESEEESILLNYFKSYDYERFPDNNWNVHVDIYFIAHQHFQIISRSSFKLQCEVKDIFTKEMTEHMVKESLDNTITMLNEKVKNKQLDFNTSMIPFQQLVVDNFSAEIIETFDEARREDESEMDEESVNAGMSFTSSDTTKLAFNATIAILDLILYKSPHFDRKHNKNIIEDALPLGAYITLRENSLKINTGDLKLNYYSGVYLIIAMDIALQLLVGDHFEKLIEDLEKAGLDDLARKNFIKFGSQLLEGIKMAFDKGYWKMDNLKVRYDWNNLIK